MGLVQNYQDYLEIEKNYSAHTVRAYLKDLDAFCRFMQEFYEVDPLDPIEAESIHHKRIRSWMGMLTDEEQLSLRTVARKIASVNSWYRYLQKTGKISKNPAARVKVPRYSKKLPSFVREDGIENLFEKIDFPEGFDGLRDKCLLEILYSCGLRRSELIGLEYKNIDHANQTLKVLGKGNKERIVPFGREARKAMRAYEDFCQKSGIDYKGAYLLRKNGNPMYARLVHRIVEKYLSMACSLQKKSPHVLRHSFATHMLDRGADLNAIKEILGHKNLAATQVYVHNSIKRLKDIHKQAHPKA